MTSPAIVDNRPTLAQLNQMEQAQDFFQNGRFARIAVLRARA